MQNSSAEAAASETAPEDSVFRTDLRSLVSGVNLIVLLLAVAAGTWGVFDSMTDADGERFWGNLAIAAPGLYAGWCMLEPALRRSTHTGAVILRLLTACFIAPALVAIPVGVIQAIALIFPGVRAAITSAQADNDGFHYYWSEGIVSQLLLVPFAGWMIGACVALGVCLIVSLPILSLRSPTVVAGGSHIEKVEGGTRDSMTAFVFCGLGATMLGTVLWVFGDGGSLLDFGPDLTRFLSTLSYGYLDWDQAAWLIGVILVVPGVLAMAWGCVRVLRARAGAARD